MSFLTNIYNYLFSSRVKEKEVTISTGNYIRGGR